MGADINVQHEAIHRYGRAKVKSHGVQRRLRQAKARGEGTQPRARDKTKGKETRTCGESRIIYIFGCVSAVLVVLAAVVTC